jgi:hypothetical protein
MTAAANSNDEEDKGADEVVAGNIPSLDEVHDRTLDKLESEDEGDDSSKEDNNSDTDDSDDDSEDSGDSDADSDSDTDGKNDDGDEKSGSADSDDKSSSSEADSKSTPELNTDIEKPGEGKVAIKGFDGKTYYFNSVDEVPDDFEPENYKSLMIGFDQLRDKKEADHQAAKAAATKEHNERVAARTKELEDSWDSDIDSLTKAKVLPADTKERQAIIDGVFDYMDKALEGGKPIDNFATAYKAYMYDKQQEENAKRDDKVKDAKKDRGSIVQDGGTKAPASGKNKVISGPPPGVSLDQVHERALGSL